MKLFFAVLLVVFCASWSSAQCLNCAQIESGVRSIFVEETVLEPVVQMVEKKVVREYREVISSARYVNAQAYEVRFSSVQAFDPACAISAAQSFQACRQSGGKFFGCLLTAGTTYLECSGGFAQSRVKRFGFFQRLRAGRQARKLSKSMTLSAGC